RVEGPEQHVHCFFRRFTNRDDLEAAARAGRPGRDFLDVDAAGNPDTDAQAQLNKLKRELRRRLPRGNVIEFKAQWLGPEQGPLLPTYGRTEPEAEPNAARTQEQ